MRPLITAALLIATLSAQDEATFFGEFKTYHINTLKQQAGVETQDTQGASAGGQLGMMTSSWHGLSATAVMMTAQTLYVPDAQAHVDASLSNNDRASQFGDLKGEALSTLGEAYVTYQRGGYDLKIGRQKLNTPWLEHRSAARLLPSTFSGILNRYKTDKTQWELAYIDGFRQRTSDRFTNPLSHALGTNTKAYTGRESAGILMASAAGTISQTLRTELYGYYMEDFLTTLYAHAGYKKEALSIDVQAIRQMSAGAFDTRLKAGATGLGAYENGVSVTMVGAQAAYGYGAHKTVMGVTHFLQDDKAFDDYIAPFDGGALYTDMLTSNNLFQSLYGKALGVITPYTGGTVGAKITQSYSFSKALNASLAVARFSDASNVSQTDINAVIGYKIDAWTFEAKGIWCFDLDHAAGLNMQQYRLIAVRPF